MIRHKVAAEVYGRHIDKYKDENLLKEIEDGGFISPHTGKPFTKVSRLLNYPFAVESVYWNGEAVIIDPIRFTYNDTIFKDIASEFLNGYENTYKFSELKLNNVGSLDYVLVKKKEEENKVDDFVMIELQSDSTTGTGKLVQNLKDLYEKGYDGLQPSYNFGMNTYNTIKLSFIQMLVKGHVAEQWNKNNVWIMQDFVFKNMIDRFDLSRNEFTKNKKVHYFIYSLIMDENDGEFKLKLSNKFSYTTNELKEAFSEQREVPSLDDFLVRLDSKLDTLF